VAELVQLKVDVIVVITLSSIRAAKQATKTIPIVMVTNQDPVAMGIIDSLAHPGGNVTGIAKLTRDLSGKRLELLKEVVPAISRVAVLWKPDDPGQPIAFKEYEAAAHALKIQLQSLEIRGPNPDLEGAFQAAAKGHANSLIVIRSALSYVTQTVARLRHIRSRFSDLSGRRWQLYSCIDTSLLADSDSNGHVCAK